MEKKMVNEMETGFTGVVGVGFQRVLAGPETETGGSPREVESTGGFGWQSWRVFLDKSTINRA